MAPVHMLESANISDINPENGIGGQRRILAAQKSAPSFSEERGALGDLVFGALKPQIRCLLPNGV